MSKELINAARKGNLEEVKRIAALKDVDINFIENISVTGIYESRVLKMTAIAEAATKGHTDVYLYLRSLGAIQEYETNTLRDNRFPSVLTMASAPECAEKMNPDIFRYLLQDIKNINPEVAQNGRHPFSIQLQSIKKSMVFTFHSEFLFYEALLRKELQILKDILSYRAINVTEASLKEYVRDRELTSTEVFNVSAAIEYLIENKKMRIAPDEINNINKMLKTNLKINFDVSAYPEELQSVLGKAPTRSLKDIFCELQHYLFPEENLPIQSVDSEVYKQFGENDHNNNVESEAEADKKRIQGFQDVKQLKKFLKLNATEITMRLGVCFKETGENPAAELLAMIACYMWDEKISVEGETVSLLDEEERKLCLVYLTKMYKMTGAEKLQLGIFQSLSNQVQALGTFVVEQKEEITELKQQNKQLVDEVKSLGSKLDQVLALLSKGLGNKPDVTPPKKTGLGIF